jgi:hypothetical protein
VKTKLNNSYDYDELRKEKLYVASELTIGIPPAKQPCSSRQIQYLRSGKTITVMLCFCLLLLLIAFHESLFFAWNSVCVRQQAKKQIIKTFWWDFPPLATESQLA